MLGSVVSPDGTSPSHKEPEPGDPADTGNGAVALAVHRLGSFWWLDRKKSCTCG